MYVRGGGGQKVGIVIKKEKTKEKETGKEKEKYKIKDTHTWIDTWFIRR